MFTEDINYINKILRLRQRGYNIIDNVDFEILDSDSSAFDIAVTTGSDVSKDNGTQSVL